MWKKRIKISIGVLTLIFLGVLAPDSRSQTEVIINDPERFSLSNPDGKKYEFVKTYVMALEYLYHNENAKDRAPVIGADNIQDIGVITDEQDRLINVNVNLRIARNLLKRFEETNNALINKVVKIFSAYVNKQVELNNMERLLVVTIREKLIEDTYDEGTLKWYFEELIDISKERKESSMRLLESSLIINKVLISHQFDQFGQPYKLGITQEERDSLISRLKIFEDPKFQGELRSGQTFLEASVSVIRQILEDTSWLALEYVSS